MSAFEGPKQYLQRLPAKLLVDILSGIPDANSLANAALTCHALYDTLNLNQDKIVNAVVVGCIGASVLPEALLAHTCSPPGSPTSASYARYLRQFIPDIQKRRQQTPKCSMRMAIDLCAFHTQIACPLQDRFVTACTSPASALSFPELRESLDARPLSQLENERIFKNLYRYEIFCRLFGYSSKASFQLWHDIEDNFLKQYSGWEMAQMSGIQDFLINEVIPIYENVAANDIVWGKMDIPYGPDMNDRKDRLQPILDGGLAQILKTASLRQQPFPIQVAALNAMYGGPYRFQTQIGGGFLGRALRTAGWKNESPLDWADLTGRYAENELSTDHFLPEDSDQGSEGMSSWDLDRNDWRHERRIWLNHPYPDAVPNAYPRYEWHSAHMWGDVMWDHARHDDLVLQRESRPKSCSNSSKTAERPDKNELWKMYSDSRNFANKLPFIRRIEMLELIESSAYVRMKWPGRKSLSKRARIELHKEGFRGHWLDPAFAKVLNGIGREIFVKSSQYFKVFDYPKALP